MTVWDRLQKLWGMVIIELVAWELEDNNQKFEQKIIVQSFVQTPYSMSLSIVIYMG